MNIDKQWNFSLSNSVVARSPFQSGSNCRVLQLSANTIENDNNSDDDVARSAVHYVIPIGSRIGKRSRRCTKTLDVLCANMVAYVLSFLELHEIERFGLISKTYQDISRHSSLWTSIKLRRSDTVCIDTLCGLVRRTSPNLPLLDLDVSGYPELADMDSCCSCQSSHPQSSPTSYGQNGVTHTNADKICGLSGSCPSCTELAQVSPYFRNLRRLSLNCVSWGAMCSLQSIIASTTTLVTLSITHDVDVNALIRCVSSHCPLLQSLHFSYVNVLAFEHEVGYSRRSTASVNDGYSDVQSDDGYSTTRSLSPTSSTVSSTPPSSPLAALDDVESDSDSRGAFSHPLLLPEVGKELSERCPLIRQISFSHYTIDEEGVQQILHLPRIEEANFSDNESLHGTFLADIPARWPQLKSLTLRDCTELTDEHVSSFASLLAAGGCPQLRFVDFSCQWAFYHTSLLSPSGREDIVRARRAVFTSQHPRAASVLYRRNGEGIGLGTIAAVTATTPTQNVPHPLPDTYVTAISPAVAMMSDENGATVEEGILSFVTGLRSSTFVSGCALRWREDQCEIPGFGVDPDDGIDSIDDELMMMAESDGVSGEGHEKSGSFSKDTAATGMHWSIASPGIGTVAESWR